MALDPASSAAALLVEARMRSKLTQAELAAAAGTSQSAVSEIESGRREPTMQLLRRLLRAAGFDVEVRLRARTAGANETTRSHASPVRGYRRERPMKELSKDDRRSLALHDEIADRLLSDPAVLATARRRLAG